MLVIDYSVLNKIKTLFEYIFRSVIILWYQLFSISEERGGIVE